MMTYVSASPTEVRKNFFTLLEQVVNNNEIITIKRREGENVVLIAESDLDSLYESAYLFKSPKNAQRLLDALERSKLRDSLPIERISTEEAIAQLKQECSLAQETPEVR
jgi:antitoxin YefM